MEKNDQTTQILIDKFLKGNASEKEINQLNSLYHSIDDTEVHLPDITYQEMIARKQSMLHEIQNGSIKSMSTKKSVSPTVWMVAASVALIIGLGFYFLTYQSNSRAEENILVKSTKWGQKQTLVLSDGSVVKLNAGSSIFFPEKFGQESREVKLIGEAFFEVEEDSKRPFKVLTGDIRTIVLGTSFNVNAYPDQEMIDISLVTGKVRVESANYADKAIDPIYLIPGEQASYMLSTLYIKKHKYDADEMLSWKNGIIYFKNADEATLVDKLEKWYNVDINVLNGTQNKIDITTKFDNASLENVLTSLGYTLGFDFKIENKKVEISYLN